MDARLGVNLGTLMELCSCADSRVARLVSPYRIASAGAGGLTR